MPFPRAVGGVPNPDVPRPGAWVSIRVSIGQSWAEAGRQGQAPWDPLEWVTLGITEDEARGTKRKGVRWSLSGFPSMWWPREHSPQAGWPASQAWPTGQASGADGGGLVQLPQAARLHLDRHPQDQRTTAGRGGKHGVWACDSRGEVLTTTGTTGGQRVWRKQGKGYPCAAFRGEE